MRKPFVRHIGIVLLSVMLFLSAELQVDALADNTYIVNGKSIYLTMASDPGDSQCWEYANRIYNAIWGTRFDSGFAGSAGSGHNMLRNLGDDDRRLTVDHIQKFIGFSRKLVGSGAPSPPCGHLSPSRGRGKTCTVQCLALSREGGELARSA